MAEVRLYKYDLSMGMAAGFGRALLGIDVEGIWHTGISVFGIEYFYGGGLQTGLSHAQVIHRFGLQPTPVEGEVLGVTQLDKDTFDDFVNGLRTKYAPETYNLFDNNCNNFSDEACRFLLDGQGIPQEIMDLPERIRSTPLGRQVFEQYGQMLQRRINADPLAYGSGDAASGPPVNNLPEMIESYGEGLVSFFRTRYKNGCSQTIDCIYSDDPFHLYVSGSDPVKEWGKKVLAGQYEELDEDERFTHILNMAGSEISSVAYPRDFFKSEDSPLEFLELEVTDSERWCEENDVVEIFDIAVAFILDAKETGGRCLVHCSAGMSRSGAVALAFLLTVNQDINLEDLLFEVRSRRKYIYPGEGFMKGLLDYEVQSLGKPQPSFPEQAIYDLHLDSPRKQVLAELDELA